VKVHARKRRTKVTVASPMALFRGRSCERPWIHETAGRALIWILFYLDLHRNLSLCYSQNDVFRLKDLQTKHIQPQQCPRRMFRKHGARITSIGDAMCLRGGLILGRLLCLAAFREIRSQGMLLSKRKS
jgi:hypothetical protein